MTTVEGERTGQARIAPEVQARLERVAVWLMVPFLLAFAFGWIVLGQLVPPPSPGGGVEQIAEVYASRTTRIRVGLLLVLFTGMLTVGFNVMMARCVRRIEGHWGVLSLAQFGVGLMFPVLVTLPMMFGEVAAFRPDRDPEITQALSDMFFLWAIGSVGAIILQALILGVATFLDGGEEPIFPRWFGYLNLWYAILAIPGGTVVLFHSGPLAWNGMVGFWVPVIAFGIWIVCGMVVLLRSIDREYAVPSAGR